MISKLWQRLFELSGRQAKVAPACFNGLKTCGQTWMMWLIFLGIGPFFAWKIESFLRIPRFSFPTGLAVFLFLGGAVVANLSAYFMVTRGAGTPLPLDSTNKLVIAGPYRFIRNPMAFASLVQGWAIGLGFGSPLILIYVFIGALMWNYGARPWEEHDLERKFGADYTRYKQNVRCWIPRFRHYNYKLHAQTIYSVGTTLESRPPRICARRKLDSRRRPLATSRSQRTRFGPRKRRR